MVGMSRRVGWHPQLWHGGGSGGKDEEEGVVAAAA